MLKRFLGYYKPHKWLFILDMSVAFISSALAVFYPILTRSLLKEYIPNKNFQMVWMMIFMMLGVMVFKAVNQFIRMKWGHILGVRMESDMRADIFQHLQKLSFSYFDNVKTGHIMSRISNDLNTIAEVAHHAPEDLTISVFMIIGSFIAMFTFNTKLAFIALIPIPALLIWGMTIGHRMKGGFRKVRKRIADINSQVENSVQGIREVKSYANENLEIDRFDNVNQKFRLAKENMYTLMATFFTGMEFLTDFYYILVIAGGAFLINQGSLDTTDLLVFIMYVNFILKPIQRLVHFVEQFQQGATAFERFIEIMDIMPDIEDKPDASNLKDIKGRVEVNNIKFRYTENTSMVLDDVTLDVPSGKTVALVGESGAGKSTLVSLIPRFYELSDGQILIDGKSISDIKQRCLRNNIGLVQQSLFLFDTTIRDNITYGKPDASEEEIIAAAQKANIWKFIESLPNGLDTTVGEHGVKLSGGQKQRISIARVFLKNPPILIFDEATSSLDTESEALIQASMETLRQGRTTIIIAHRLSTVKNADFIYVLKDGKIIEKGSHKSLMELNQYYHKLYTRNLI